MLFNKKLHHIFLILLLNNYYLLLILLLIYNILIIKLKYFYRTIAMRSVECSLKNRSNIN